MKLKVIFFTVIISALLIQCKKDTNTSTKLIDDLVGTYIVYDTLTDVAGGCGGPITTKTYSCVVTKTSETTIKISYFYNQSADFDASISGNNITVTGGFLPYGTYNPVITRSGTTLFGTYSFFQTSCHKDGKVKAVKQ